MMTSSVSRKPYEERSRQRSRYGCRNCKLRKLKCDEGRPHCKRCSSFGLLCNFMSNIPDLHPIVAGTVNPLATPRKAEPHPPVSSAVWTSDQFTAFQLDTKCQDFINRYLGQSLITQNDPLMKEVNRKLLGMAFVSPLLMHASLGVAFAYDRHLNGPFRSRRSLEECYHGSQSIALFKKQLVKPIDAQERDPLWGTAAALAILAFSSLDVCTPEESWPLKASSSPDMGWLDMIDGKMSLWHLVNPLRPDSIFRDMSTSFADMFSPLPKMGIYGIPKALATMCLLEDSSTADNNPYFNTVHTLSRLLGLQNCKVTAGQVQLFVNTINGSFRTFLEKKDPVALMLLYIWYRKASRSIWWIELRARVECPSIYTYLQKYYPESTLVEEFLCWAQNESFPDTDDLFSFEIGNLEENL